MYHCRLQCRDILGRMYELVNFVSLLIIRVAMEEVGYGACFQFGYYSET